MDCKRCMCVHYTQMHAFFSPLFADCTYTCTYTIVTSAVHCIHHVFSIDIFHIVGFIDKTLSIFNYIINYNISDLVRDDKVIFIVVHDVSNILNIV